MKKKWLLGIFTGLCAAACVVGFSACGHTHDYTEVVTNPTCTAQGYTTYACECGKTYKDRYIEATGHNFTEYVSDNNATYDSDGTKTATCDNGCGATDSISETGTKLKSEIAFKTLCVDGTIVYGKVSNATTRFSFLDEVETRGNATYLVGDDIDCSFPITSKTVDLEEGVNTFYVSELVGDDKKVYTVTIYRRHKFTVSFDTTGGTQVQRQTVEEDDFATVPTAPARMGYTFDGWDYDFTKPITDNGTITAQWKVNQYAITIVYGNGQVDKIITQDYGTVIEAEEPVREGYAFVGWDNMPATMPAENRTVTAQWSAIYTLCGGSITGLTDYGKANYTALDIPSVIDGVFITSIGSNAFEDCSGLTEVVVPDSVTSIGSNAFYGCSSLTGMTLPFVGASKEATDYEAVFGYIFGYTVSRSYTSISGATHQWQKGDKRYFYYIPMLLRDVMITGGTIGDYAFANCSSLTEIVISDGVTGIGVSAFANCSSLKEIVIPVGVTSIDNMAFFDCSSLKEVVIPVGVVGIGEYVFGYCSSLTEIVIPDSVTSIGNWAFEGCSSLKEIVIPVGVMSIGSSVFHRCSSLTIYCEATKKPDGWISDWNFDNRPVEWGYKGN